MNLNNCNVYIVVFQKQIKFLKQKIKQIHLYIIEDSPLTIIIDLIEETCFKIICTIISRNVT